MKKIRQFIAYVLILFLIIANSDFTVLAAVGGDETEAIITGFKVLDSSCITLSGKYSLEKLISQMPDTIGVYLNNSDEITEIPVIWESEIDYEDTDYSYYLFWAKWDTDKYALENGYNLEDYLPFIEVVLDSPSVYSTNKEETGISNIVARAYQQVQIEWTPLQTVNGFLDSSGTLTGVFYAGTTYNGIPYGQPVYSGRYVPHNASFDTFLNAVKDSGSLFYTDRGTYGSLDAPYYSNDCSAFVSYAYGLPRMTTSTIANSSRFTAVSGNNIANAQVGDCFNKGGSHVQLITGISYNSDGSIANVEVSEQTPPKARTITYTAAKVQSIIDSGYTLLRFNGRYDVAEPDTYGEVMGSEIEISGQNSPGTITQGSIFSISGVVSSGETLSNVTVGVYDIDGSMQTGKSVNPSSTSYNIKNVDNDIRFNDLSPGIYCYKVTASNSEITETLVEKVFVVLAVGNTIDQGTYVIEPDGNSSLALDISRHSDDSGVSVQLGNKDNIPYQAFWFKEAGDGYYYVINCASGKYLSVYGGSNISGADVQQDDEDESTSQKWQVLPVGNGYCLVPQCGTDLCLNSHGGESSAGINIEVCTADMTVGQLFHLQQANGNFQSGNRITFDLQGGSVSGAYKTYAVNGVNIGRASESLVIYNVPGTTPDTNAYGREAVVNADGKVTNIRSYGSETQLIVPKGGFIVSGHSNGGYGGVEFTSELSVDQYVGYDYSTKIVSAYRDQSSYLIENKYVESDGVYGTLPEPDKEGCIFEGWYTAVSGGTKITEESNYSSDILYAHWIVDKAQCEHSYDGGIVTKAPTSTSDGIKTYTCTICGETKEEIIFYDFSCGEDLKWDLENGILTIRGSGAMTNWGNAEEVPWYAERDDIKEIILEDGVTTAGDWAFAALKAVKSASLSAALEKVGTSAFRECSSLENFVIPDKVSVIGSNAFRYCSSLTEIHFEGAAPEIANNAFFGVEATGYYPADDITWTLNVRKDYGGTLTWKVEKERAFAIISQPSDYTGLVGETAIFSVEAAGEDLVYQWQYQNVGVTVWKPSGQAGNRTSCINVPITEARNGQKYRCVITDETGSQMISDEVSLYVRTQTDACVIVTQPADYTGPAGSMARFTVEVKGESLAYQWQYQNVGTTVWKASGQTGNKTSSVNIPITEARNGQKYRCVVTDRTGNQVISDEAVLYMERSTDDSFTIIAQPSDCNGKVGEMAVFAVKVSGEGLTYQWQYQNVGATVWKASGQIGNKTNSVSIPITEARNGQKYRCAITDASGHVLVTEAAILNVVK